MEASTGEYSVDEDNQLQAEDTLIDRGVDDVLDEGYSPPERPYGRGSSDSSLRAWTSCLPRKSRIRQCGYMTRSTRTSSNAPMKPSVNPISQRNEVGRARAGRLVACDQGFGKDIDADLVADDVGLGGGAASAEEAAVHIIDDEE